MRKMTILALFCLLVSGCSETNLDDLDETELNEIEAEIEEEAKSLEEAAAEAVKILEEEIQTDLNDAGVGVAQESLSESSDSQETVEE